MFWLMIEQYKQRKRFDKDYRYVIIFQQLILRSSNAAGAESILTLAAMCCMIKVDGLRDQTLNVHLIKEAQADEP